MSDFYLYSRVQATKKVVYVTRHTPAFTLNCFFKHFFLVAQSNCIRGFVHPTVRRTVRPSVMNKQPVAQRHQMVSGSLALLHLFLY